MLPTRWTSSSRSQLSSPVPGAVFAVAFGAVIDRPPPVSFLVLYSAASSADGVGVAASLPAALERCHPAAYLVRVPVGQVLLPRGTSAACGFALARVPFELGCQAGLPDAARQTADRTGLCSSGGCRRRGIRLGGAVGARHRVLVLLRTRIRGLVAGAFAVVDGAAVIGDEYGRLRAPVASGRASPAWSPSGPAAGGGGSGTGLLMRSARGPRTRRRTDCLRTAPYRAATGTPGPARRRCPAFSAGRGLVSVWPSPVNVSVCVRLAVPATAVLQLGRAAPRVRRGRRGRGVACPLARPARRWIRG